MRKASQFVVSNPETAMRKFAAGLRKAVKISPSQMNALVEHDNAQREARRAESGQAKRGPKPKA